MKLKINQQKIEDMLRQLPPYISFILRLPYRLVKSIGNQRYRKRLLYKFKYRERKTSYGIENPDKTFLIIRRVSEIEGHFSIINSVLGHLARADKEGLLPVVDMQNHYNSIWQTEDKRGIENAWEYFYHQPANYNLSDIKKSQNIIHTEGGYPYNGPSYVNIIAGSQELLFWHQLYLKYIQFNQPTLNYLQGKVDKFQVSERNVLGVSIRRGIEWGQKTTNAWFSGYARHPEIDEVIHKTADILKQSHCDYLFLSIDDHEGLAKMKGAFGSKLLYIERKRSHYFKNDQPLPLREIKALNSIEDPDAAPEKHEHPEIKYLSEIYIISKCNSIICSNTSANATAMIMNGGRYAHVLVL